MLARTCPSPSVKCGDFAELYVFNHLQTWKPLLILGRSLQPCWRLFAHWSRSKVEKTARIPRTSNCITYTVKSCRDLARKHPTVFLPCQNYPLARFATNYTKIYYLSEVQMCLKKVEMELRACLREHSQRGVRFKRKEKGEEARTLSAWALFLFLEWNLTIQPYFSPLTFVASILMTRWGASLRAWLAACL